MGRGWEFWISIMIHGGRVCRSHKGSCPCPVLESQTCIVFQWVLLPVVGGAHTSSTVPCWQHGYNTAASESLFPPSTGIVIGVVLRYAIPPQGQPEYYLAATDDNCSEGTKLLAGERIELISFTGDNDTEERFICQVVGRVFKTSQGNYIQQTVCACRLQILRSLHLMLSISDVIQYVHVFIKEINPRVAEAPGAMGPVAS